MEIASLTLNSPNLFGFEKFPGLATLRVLKDGQLVEHEKHAVAIIQSGQVWKFLVSPDERIVLDIYNEHDMITFSAINMEIPTGSKIQLVAVGNCRILFFPQHKLVTAALEGQYKLAREFLGTGKTQPARLATYLRWQYFEKGEEISMSDSDPPKLYWIVKGSCMIEKSGIFGKGSILGEDYYFQLGKSFRSPKKYKVISDMLILSSDRLGAKLILTFWGGPRFKKVLTGQAETLTVTEFKPGNLKTLEMHPLRVKAMEVEAAQARLFTKVSTLTIILLSPDLEIRKVFASTLINAPTNLIFSIDARDALEAMGSISNLSSIRIFIDPRNLEISSVCADCLEALGDPDQIYILPGSAEQPGIFKSLKSLTIESVAECLINA